MIVQESQIELSVSVYQFVSLLMIFWNLACKKATAMVFIRGDRGYPAVRFEYKTASERYLVAEL